MKKILLMLALMLPCLGAWAQISSLSDLNNTTTYTIKCVNRGFLYYDSNNAGYVTSSSHTSLVDATPTGAENEQFAFLRTDNTTEGQYYLYSKAAGQFLTYKSGNVALQLTDNPEHAWVVASASWSGNNGFTIKVPETAQTYINITNWQAQKGCKVIGTGVDAGNLMTIKAVDTEADFSSTAIAKIEKFERDFVWAEVNSVLECLAPFVDYDDTNWGFANADDCEVFIALAYASESADLTDLKELVDKCRAFILPVPKKFFRIKAVEGWNDDARYLGAKNSTASTSRAEYVANADKNTIFYGDGSSLVSYGSGNYLVSNSNFLGYNGVQAQGTKFHFGLASNKLLSAYNISFNDGTRWLYCNQNNYTDAGGRGTQNGYCFNLEFLTEIPVTISAYKFASFYAPVAMTAPEGVTAYYITDSYDVNGTTYATLTEVTNNVIPANTGVLLYSETADTYNLTIGGEATANENNWLNGTANSTYISDEAYVLGVADGKIGLYLADMNQQGNTSWINNGFKAYLPASKVSTTSNVIRFVFGGETTGIESVVNKDVDTNAPIYDLSGRRVMNTVKGGIYIQNGKKVYIK